MFFLYRYWIICWLIRDIFQDAEHVCYLIVVLWGCSWDQYFIGFHRFWTWGECDTVPQTASWVLYWDPRTAPKHGVSTTRMALFSGVVFSIICLWGYLVPTWFQPGLRNRPKIHPISTKWQIFVYMHGCWFSYRFLLILISINIGFKSSHLVSLCRYIVKSSMAQWLGVEEPCTDLALLDLPPCIGNDARRHKGKKSHDTPKYGLLYAACSGCLPCVRYWHERENVPLSNASDNHPTWDLREFAMLGLKECAVWDEQNVKDVLEYLDQRDSDSEMVHDGSEQELLAHLEHHHRG